MPGKKQNITLNRFLESLLWVLFLLTFSVTLIFNDHTGGWGRIHNFYFFYFLSFMVFFVFNILLLSRKRPGEFSISMIDTFFMLFMFYVLIQVIIMHGLGSYQEAHFSILHLLVLHFILKVLLNRSNLPVVPGLLTLLGLISASYGLIQLFGWMPSNHTQFKITGFFLNSGPYAAYIAAILPFTLILVFEVFDDKSLKPNHLLLYFLMASLIIMIIACLLSGSRTAILAVLISSLFIFNQKFSLMNRIVTIVRKKKILLLGSAAMFILIAVFLLYWKTDSSFGRILIWLISANMFLETPIFGIGHGHFAIDFPNHQAFYFSSTEVSPYFSYLAGMTYFAFNEWLQIAVESGLVGLGIFVTLLFFIFKTKTANYEVLAAKGCLIAILVQTFFFYPFSILSIQLIFTFSLAVLSVKHGNYLKIKLPQNAIRVSAAMLLLIGAVLFSDQFNKFRALKQWEKAAFLVSIQGDKALLLYEKIFPILRYKGDFLFNYGAELSELGHYEKSIEILEEAKKKFNHIDLYMFLGNSYKGLNQYEKAERNYLHASFMIPHRFYPKYLLVKLYLDTGQKIKARKLAREMVNMEVKIPSAIVSGIREEMKKILNDV